MSSIPELTRRYNQGFLSPEEYYHEICEALLRRPGVVEIRPEVVDLPLNAYPMHLLPVILHLPCDEN